MQRTIAGLQEYRVAQPLVQPQADRLRVKWKASHGEYYKINFNGAMFTEIDRAGIRVIIRDYKGFAMASLSQIIPLPLTVVELETLAAAKALEFALELGLDFDIIEGDS